MALLYVLLGALLIGAILLYRRLSWQRKRTRLLETPLTPEQRAVVAELVPIIRRLPESLRHKLEGKINLFLDQITVRGNQGLEITESMKLSIAAQACLLVVNSPAWYHPLRNVLVYPSAFRKNRNTYDGHVVHENRHIVLGESWVRGPVVLAWPDALEGGLDERDGHNVVIHEFAHQLDSLTGHTNGLPLLRKGQAYSGWQKAMLDAYHEHVNRVAGGRGTVIDPYGATNHEEFFAEAIVAFFEKPHALQRDAPALYAQLSKLLALDPVQWS
ncbi:zinc-dependent peptidase [Alterisphingorhabdus coralli]|uniref:Zinc-dependent peptidase n=1 Tax=Alterisphingorhabdus coralli TaxID=3071408 RepID=A0AA97HZK9_9SPHN|nr:zinc-dependent peptidase [Parasphingorhabdus sp. SCSIO 66989]WOE74824.1 zinc-dependent peptidase [Parasphingorhabdus sp. SCSIO 66989]